MQPHVAAVAFMLSRILRSSATVLSGIRATPTAKWIGGTRFGQLDGLELLGRDLALLEAVAALRAATDRGSCAHCVELALARDVALVGLAARRLAQ